MDDTISRYDALKTIGFLEAKNDKANGFSDDFDNISRTKSMIAINNLPSAQPKRIRGQWERIPYSFVGGYRCSICGCKFLSHEWNFCPNCGADMRGEQDG